MSRQIQGRSTIEKARVGGRRRGESGGFYYPFQECLKKCCPKSCRCCSNLWGDTSTIETDDDGETAVSPILKYALFFVNVLFWLGSLLLLGIGSWALATKELDGSKRVTSAWDFVFDVTILFIIIGCLAFLLASCGCIGALRENVCLLKTYWIALIVIDLALILIGIVGLSMWSRFLDVAKTKISKELITDYDDDPDLKDLMDFVQEKFECCGVSDQSYLDWNRNIYFNCTSSNKDPRSCGVPHSCCRPETRIPKAIKRIYTLGCVEAMENSIKHNILLFCLVAFGVALVPLIGICLAVTLSNQIDDQKILYEDQERRQRRMGPQYVITRA